MQRFYLRLFITDFKIRLSRNYKNSRYDILLLRRRTLECQINGGCQITPGGRKIRDLMRQKQRNVLERVLESSATLNTRDF